MLAPFCSAERRGQYSHGERLGNAGSGDDIRGQAVLNHGDLIAQAQFALFQPFQRQLIRARPLSQCGDGIIQIAMFAAENLQLNAQDLIGFHGQIVRGVHAW